MRANEAASRATTPRVQKLSNEHATRRKSEQSFHVRRNGRAPRLSGELAAPRSPARRSTRTAFPAASEDKLSVSTDANVRAY